MYSTVCLCVCECALKVSVTERSVCLINALTQTGTWNQSPPPAAPVRCALCVRARVCVCIPYTVPLEGLRVGVEQEAQMGSGDSERKKRKVCAEEGTIGGRAVKGMGCH